MARRIDIEAVERFIEVQNKVPAIIKAFGMSITYVCEKSGIPRATFDRKVKAKSFTGEEMLKICRAINR